jgi:hypothetical protein
MDLGPAALMKLNKSLIYARLSGFGHYPDEGLPKLAGHDINFLAMSGTFIESLKKSNLMKRLGSVFFHVELFDVQVIKTVSFS